MRAPIRLLAVVATALAVTAAGAAAQVRPPNIQGPINAAKKAAGTTSEQIKAADRVGAEPHTMQAWQMPAAAMQQRGSKAAAPQGKPPASGAAGRPETSVSQEGARHGATVTVMREMFAYNRGGRRDPFVSLMLSGELRPIVTDLVLTGVIFDESGGGRGSIAMLVDNSTGENYAVRAGQALGRMRVARIGRENITFDIDEFGLSRSETLAINKTSKAGAPAPRRP